MKTMVNHMSHDEPSPERVTAPTHEFRMPRRRIVDWGGSIMTGIIAGLICLVLWMGLTPVFTGASAWLPAHLIAATVMGGDTVRAPALFSWEIVLYACFIHLVVSVLFATVLWFIVRERALGPSIGIGALYGLAMYALIFYGLSAVYPWLVDGRGIAAAIGYVGFGIAAGWVHNRLSVRRLLASPAMPATIRVEARETSP